MLDGLIFLFHLLLIDPTTNAIVAISYVFGGNLGIAIIVFTLVMKLVTWPLTASQFKQSRAMQVLQPQLQELQKKYKGKDPKKLQSETMSLYREAGVNPLGCLFPMIAQMPIWIALYRVIGVVAGDSPEGLLTLSQRLYPISFIHQAVPLNKTLLFWNLGQSDTTYILPVLVAASMFIQQKLFTPPPTAAPASQQAQQQQQTQQMMLWMMPLMFGFFSLSVPSGLALYWFISNITGVILQYFYMGRKVQLSQLFQFGPPSPAPAAKLKAAQKQAKPEPVRELASELPQDIEQRNMASKRGASGNGTNQRGEATEPADAQSGRRNKNGRRRGKR